MNSKQIHERLLKANADVARLLKRDMKANEGPSLEYLAAYKLAKETWREWCDALDREEANP